MQGGGLIYIAKRGRAHEERNKIRIIKSTIFFYLK